MAIWLNTLNGYLAIGYVAIHLTMVRKTVLENGIRIVTEEIPHVRSASIGFWIGTGSKYESENIRGISHFTEHMVFKGTSSRTAKEIARTIESVGGSLNAATNKEHTLYYAKVLSDHLPMTVEILSDMLLNSVFAPEDIEKEKKVVLEEIRMYEDSPEDIAHELFTASVWRNHNLGKSILGRRETVSVFTREDILSYVRDYYLPSRMIISAAGYLNHDSVVSQARKLWGKQAHKNRGKKQRESPAQISPGLSLRKKETEQVHFCLGARGLSQVHKERYTLVVLDTLLGGGMSSRLFQEVREKTGLVYSIYSFQSSYRYEGLFAVSAGTGIVNLEKVTGLILKEFRRLREHGAGKTEIEKTKEHLKGALMLGLESTSARMLKLGRSEFYLGRDVSLDELMGEIDQVSQDDIKRLAAQLLQPRHLTFAGVGPFTDENTTESKLKEVIYSH